jgi:hypothetical protein
VVGMRPNLQDWRDFFSFAQADATGKRARLGWFVQPLQCDTIVASRKAKFVSVMGIFYHAHDAFFTAS